ncbi:MAG: LacI family DNA-binding transcriptional regulator [Methylobacteriaceae bacterium]|nr:LacI family DNA-binding transcriptional regulator [Methylobacteriaceae bacterium]
MSVTIRDVSVLAGVSLSTVSHVINNTRAVSEEARRRVLEAIRQTGYTPNSLARSLKVAETRTIGIAVGDLPNPYFTDVIYALEARARQSGFTILLSDHGNDPELELQALRVLAERRVDGIVLAPASNRNRQALEYLDQRGIPFVQIDRIADPSRDYVVARNKAATRGLVRHLCEIGHRRIAMLAGLNGLSTSSERIAGFKAGMRDCGLEADPGLIVSGLSRIEPAQAATLVLMRRPAPPTGIVAGNNLMALGAMRALRELNLRVPQDIALVSFDDFAWADLFSPRMTTIAQPCREIGERAMDMLLDRLRLPGGPARGLRLPATLQHRQSCGCGMDGHA